MHLSCDIVKYRVLIDAFASWAEYLFLSVGLLRLNCRKDICISSNRRLLSSRKYFTLTYCNLIDGHLRVIAKQLKSFVQFGNLYFDEKKKLILTSSIASVSLVITFTGNFL